MNAAYRLAYVLIPLAMVAVVAVLLHHAFASVDGIVIGGTR